MILEDVSSNKIMKFKELTLSGAYLIEDEPHKDERGEFARAFCSNEFSSLGLSSKFVQCNLCRNNIKGTLRGIHYQNFPMAEVKLVRCVKGSIYDVIVDLRKESPTYLQWHGEKLTDDNGLMLYVPKGFAHGYQTLEDNTSIHYMVSEFYAPEYEKGLHFQDPLLAIKWPIDVSNLSRKDACWPKL